MGQSQSSSGEKTGKSVIESKLSMAAKTGVLNVSGQGIKFKSSLWKKLSCETYVSKLKSLDVSNNPIKEFPYEITQLSKVKTLILCKCNFSSLPPIDHLSCLTSLNVSDNCLDDNGIGGLPLSLTKLDISYNRLISFPISLSSLVNLTELNLSNNAIVVLDGIGQLHSLVWLILDNNDISFVPHEIGNLNRLKHISLKSNSITKSVQGQQSISPQLFISTAVDEINLHNNQLTQDDLNKFEGVEEFLKRRQKNKDRLLQGGGMLDFSVFGLE